MLFVSKWGKYTTRHLLKLSQWDNGHKGIEANVAVNQVKRERKIMTRQDCFYSLSKKGRRLNLMRQHKG